MLIGAPTRGLVGVDADLDMMDALARRFGFAAPVVVRDATLAAIRRHLGELLDLTRVGDPVLLYLTGHGGVVANRDYDFRASRPAAQRLHYFATVPEADGRDQGLFDVELSLWCARLAGRTANVVVVVDACFSGGLVRDGAAEQAFLDEFDRWRDAHQDEIDALDVEGHPDVVRLSAAGVNGVARAGGNGSALTTCLVAALAEEGASGSSWLGLFGRIEARLARAGVAQEPRLSGPVRRRVFDLESTLPPGAFAVRCDGEQLLLAGGAEQGVVPGDVFLVSDAGAERWAEVDEVRPTSATLRRSGGSHAEVSPAAFAVPLRLRGLGAASVAGDGPVKRSVEAELAGAGWDTPGPGDGPALARITCTPHVISVRGRTSGLAVELVEASQCAEVLRRFARVERLQGLGAMPLSSLGLRASWGRVCGGACEPLHGRDAVVDASDPIYVRIENLADARRFISVFWIADDGEGSQLSRSESMGVELAGKTTYTLGDRPFSRAPRGVVPPRRPMAPGERRAERLVLVATTRRQALWSFDTASPGGRRRSIELVASEVVQFTAVGSKPVSPP